MQINLIAVGQKLPNWINQGFQEYAKQLPFDLNLIEIPLAKRSKNTSISQILAREGEQMIKALPNKGQQRIIALDVLGQSFRTEEIAEKMKSWQMDGRDISLLIGGPDGLAPI